MPSTHLPVQQKATKSFTIYLADASSSVPPPKFLEHVKHMASEGAIHGFSGKLPAKGPACPPLPGGAANQYCWSLNWNVYEPPKVPALAS